MKVDKTKVPLKGGISPGVLEAEDDVASPWVDVSEFNSVMTLAQVGLKDGSVTTLSFEQATTDDNPSGPDKKALSAWTGGTLSADDSALQVDNDPAKMDTNGGFRFARAVLTVNDGGDPVVSLAMFGVEPKNIDPANPEAATATPANVYGG